jgi:hypothetical protein
MVAEEQPPSANAVMRAGTREQLIALYRLSKEDFTD